MILRRPRVAALLAVSLVVVLATFLSATASAGVATGAKTRVAASDFLATLASRFRAPETKNHTGFSARRSGNTRRTPLTVTFEEAAFCSYSPWGEHLAGAEPGFTFQGLKSEKLGDSGELLGAMLRHASPRLGRWLSRDPGGFLSGQNRHSWLGNNPLRFVDPVGQREIENDPGLTPFTQINVDVEIISTPGSKTDPRVTERFRQQADEASQIFTDQLGKPVEVFPRFRTTQDADRYHADLGEQLGDAKWDPTNVAVVYQNRKYINGIPYGSSRQPTDSQRFCQGLPLPDGSGGTSRKTKLEAGMTLGGPDTPELQAGIGVTADGLSDPAQREMLAHELGHYLGEFEDLNSPPGKRDSLMEGGPPRGRLFDPEQIRILRDRLGIR